MEGEVENIIEGLQSSVEYKWSVGWRCGRDGWIKWGVRPRILMRIKAIVTIIVMIKDSYMISWFQ